MAAKSILEADGKAILNYHLTRAPVIKPSPLPAASSHNPPSKLASLHFPEDADVNGILDQAETTYPWLLAQGAKFVAKPDQLIKRRGKSGLLALNKTWPEARAWIEARAGKQQQVETVKGYLRQFLVEPFVPHPEGTEYYININSVRDVSLPLRSCPDFESQTFLDIYPVLHASLDTDSSFARALLTSVYREIGFSSRMKVVSTLAMLTRKPKSSSSPLIFRNTRQTKKSPLRC